MDNTIQSTEYVLPLSFLDNGLLGAAWTNPAYLLLRDDQTAESNSSQASVADVIAANFNLNVPVGAVITGIKFKIRGYVGAITVPPASLSFNYVDNSSGENVYVPYTAPFTGFTQSMAEYEFGGNNYLFDRIWTVDEINNFKLQLLAAGNIFIDDVQVQALYYVPVPTVIPSDGSDTCLSCESQIQGVEYFLALNLQATDTKAYVYNFNYASGTPITISDLGDCGGTIDVVLDEGKVAGNGQNFMENVRITNITQLPSGLVELDFGSLENRGLSFHGAAVHSDDLLSPHSVNAKLIISNNSPFYDKFVKKCQKGILFSAPITVEDEGDEVVTGTETFNFIGDSVQAEQDGTDPKKVNITILSAASNVLPDIEDKNGGSTGSGTSDTITFPIVITDANYLRVGVSGDNISTSSVKYNGVTMALVGSKTNAPANLKVEIYELVNPVAGTHNVVVTKATTCHFSAGGMGFIDVDTINPTDGISAGAIGSSTAPSDSVTTTQDNVLLMDVVGTVNNPTTFTQSAPWTVQIQTNAAARPIGISTRKVLVPGVTADTYAINPTQDWAIIIAGVRGIATPVGGVDSVTGLNTDNSDPANPVVQISVDGATITGSGTPGDPLVANTGGVSGVVYVDADDTTAGYLADKIEFTSDDASVTITPTIINPGGDEVLSLDFSVPPSSASSVYSQSAAISTNALNAFAATSYSDGTVYVLGAILGSSATITRYKLDTATGKYYAEESISALSYSPKGAGSTLSMGIAVVGDYVYTNYNDTFTSTNVLVRYSRLSLSGSETLMTISGTGPGTGTYHSMYSDTTHLYIASSGTTWYEYSISGTTATNIATITQLASVIASICPDGTNVYLTTDQGTFGAGVFTRTNLTGGSAVTNTRKLLFGVAATNIMAGFANIDATKLYVMSMETVTNATATVGSNVMFEPITKPS